MGPTIKYFAYGSNMCDAWLQSRVRSARALTTARLPGHVLRFHKRSEDGSAKCNVVKTERTEDEVYGVIFEIDRTKKPLLDKAEGLGSYVEAEVKLFAPGGSVNAYTYVAETVFIRESLKPYTWYKAAIEDQDPARVEKARVILSRCDVH